MRICLLEGLYGVEKLVLGLAGEGGGHLLEFRAVVDVVVKHIGQHRQSPIRPLRQVVAVVVGVGMVMRTVVVVMVVRVRMGVGVLHAVVAVGMGVLVAVFHDNRSYLRAYRAHILT